jgi:hypothetical protein
MTGVLKDVVRDALAGCPDIALLEDGCGSPTAVVCASGSPEEVLGLLYAFPRVRVLTIVDDGRTGFVHELVPRTVALGELSPERLVAAIRGAS